MRSQRIVDTAKPEARLFIDPVVAKKGVGGVDALSRVFAALADPTRRDVVARLADGDATVGEIAEPYPMSLQAISRRVQVLESAGLASKTRVAQQCNVHLESEVLDLATAWLDRYRRAAESRYRGLVHVLAELDETANPCPGQALS